MPCADALCLSAHLGQSPLGICYIASGKTASRSIYISSRPIRNKHHHNSSITIAPKHISNYSFQHRKANIRYTNIALAASTSMLLAFVNPDIIDIKTITEIAVIATRAVGLGRKLHTSMGNRRAVVTIAAIDARATRFARNIDGMETLPLGGVSWIVCFCCSLSRHLLMPGVVVIAD